MKFYNPVLLFLDDDLNISAQSFTNRYLDLMIRRTNQVLFCGLFYFIGIRNKKFYNFYFTGDKKKESIDKWFSSYPLKKFPPFSFYNSVESRWVRKCANHYLYLVDYLISLLDEYSYRNSREHELDEMRDFHTKILLNLTLMNGIVVPMVKMNKIMIPWKNLAPLYRKKNIIEGYRKYYRSQLVNVIDEYSDVKRDIPEWLIDKQTIFETEINI